MADVESRVVITAVNQTAGAFGAVDTSLAGMASKLGAVAIAAGGVAAVVGGAKWLSDLTGKSIEAAGHLADLAQSTGVSGETLSRYAHSAKMAGTDVDGLASGLQKLNIKIDEASTGGGAAATAFARLGVSVNDSNGKIRSTDEVLGDIADAFSEMEDGAGKTAVAVDLFGKAGATLIPFLNQGRDGLEEAARAADALGLTLSNETIAAADMTGDALDTVGAIATGLGNKIMAEVLPTVLQMTRSFTDFIVETGALDVAAQAAAGAFRVMVNAGQILYGTFEFLGKIVGATAAAIALVAQGEFKAAALALEDGFTDAGKAIEDTSKNISKTWNTTVSDVVAGVNKQAPKMRELAEATKAVKPEVDKAADAMLKLFDAIDDKIVATEREIATGRTATDVDKLRTQFLKGLENGTIAATEADQAAYEALLKRLQAANETIESDRTRLRLAGELTKAVADEAAALNKQADDVQELVAKQRQENSQIGLNKTALQELTAKRLEEKAALVDQEIENRALIGTLGGEHDALVAVRDGYITLAAEMRSGAARQAVVDAADEAKRKWEDTSKTIETSLTDALMRGFESGKGFVQNLIDSAKNLFSTLVLRPVIQAVVQPIAGGITSFLGLPGSASAAGGAGNSLGMLGNLAGFASNPAGAFAGPLASAEAAFGAGGVFGGEAITAASLGELGLVGGSGAAAGGASILGTLGAAAPYLAAALALYSLVGNAGETRGGSSYAYSASSGAQQMLGQSLDLTAGQVISAGGPSGGAIGGRSGEDQTGRAVAATVQGINDLFDTLGSTARVDAFWGKLETSGDNRGGVLAGGRLSNGRGFGETGAGSNYAGTLFEAGTATSLDGQTAVAAFALDLQQATVQALQAASDIPQTIADLLVGVDAEALTAEDAAALTAKIAAIGAGVEALGGMFDGLGGVFEQISPLSFDAKASLIELAGGLDAFASKARSYVQNFFSGEEQTGLAANQILNALGAVGIDAGGLSSREEFRALADSLDLSTEQGRTQFAAILDVSSAFAGISEKLADSSLDAAAQLAPGGAAYEILSVSNDAAQENVTQITAVADSTQLVADSTNLISSQNAEYYPRIAGALDAINGGLDAIYVSTQAAVSAASSAAAAASAAASAAQNASSSASLLAAAPTYTDNIGA